MFRGMSLHTSFTDRSNVDYEISIDGYADANTLQELAEVISNNRFTEDHMLALSERKATKAKFGGMFLVNGKKVYITKVIYNAPATIVFWSDNTKTTARCETGDTWNNQAGLLTCVFKKLLGSDKTLKLISDWTPEKNLKSHVKDLKTVRKTQKKQIKQEVKNK